MAETHERSPSVIDRYYTRWYKTGFHSNQAEATPESTEIQDQLIKQLESDMKGRSCEDHCILQHSNRICIITLAESHPILQQGRKIKSIDYRISDGCSRLNNKVSGKAKRGGQFLTEFAPLCRIMCTDDTEYTIFGCIRGRLLEVNEDILKRPDLLLEKPSTDGYIAVILPKLEESKTITKGLLTREQYEDVVSKRSTQPQESL